MRMKKLNKDLITFINVANQTPIGAETKLAKKLAKQNKVFSSAIEPYNDSLETAQIDNCSVDEKGNIIKDTDKKSFIYSKEGLKALNTKIKELQGIQVDVEVFLTAADLKECPASHRNYYMDFIGAEETEEAAPVASTDSATKTTEVENKATTETTDTASTTDANAKTTQAENKTTESVSN